MVDSGTVALVTKQDDRQEKNRIWKHKDYESI